MTRSGTAEACRVAVYRYGRRAALDDVFFAPIDDIAAELGISKVQVRSALAVLTIHGVLTVELRHAGTRPAQYRILTPLRIVTVSATPKPPKPKRPVMIALPWYTPERAALLIRLWPTYLPSAIVRAEARKLAGPEVPNSAGISGVMVRLGIRRPADVMSNKIAIAAAALEFGFVVPAPIVVPVVDPVPGRYPEQRTRLVPPGTYPASGFTMIGRAR